MDELTEKVLEYKKTGAGLEELQAKIRVLVYFFPRKCSGWTMEESSDFFFHFQHRIPRLLENFRYMGKKFSSYLAACIRFQMLGYHKHYFQSRQAEECLCRDQEQEAEEAIYHYSQGREEESSVKDVSPLHPFGDLSQERNRRKVLLLCLKSSYYLDAATIDTLAELLRMPKQSLHSLIQELRSDLERTSPKLENLRHRGIKIFLLLNFYQKRKSEELDPEKLPRWNRLCDHYSLLLQRNRRALKTLKIEPRHETIARLTGIPKGSVDSSLHSLKKRMAEYLKN